jgi:hypothetical protein
VNSESRIVDLVGREVRAAVVADRRRRRSRRAAGGLIVALCGVAVFLVVPSLGGDILDSPYNPALQPTPSEIAAAGPGDAAVNAAGPGMIRCDASLSCLPITPSPTVVAADPNVYVRVVNGGLTPARLAFHVPLFAANDLSCTGSTVLTCVRASVEPPLVPAGVTAIATYTHPHVQVMPDGRVIIRDDEPLTVAPRIGQ